MSKPRSPQTDRERWKRLKRDEPYPADVRAAESIRQSLFDRQREPFDDPNRRVVCVCGRKAGKSTVVVAKVLATALLHPGSECHYIALSHDNARTLGWKPLKEALRKHGVDLKKDPSETFMEVQLANGATVHCGGVDNVKHIEKFRGTVKQIVCVDETKSWNNKVLKEFVNEVIKPDLVKTKGALWMIGTPGPMRKGFFFDASKPSSEWSKYAWTMWENPFVEDPDAAIAEMAEEDGQDDPSSPAYLREYKGQWVEDKEGKLYAFDEEKNSCADGLLPDRASDGRLRDWRYMLGADLGSVDAFALVLMACDRSSGDMRVLSATKEHGLDIDQAAERIRGYQIQFNLKHGQIIVDEGALGKMIGDTFRNKRLSIPAKPATKQNKRLAVSWLNSELRKGKLKVCPSAHLLSDEWRAIERDPETGIEVPGSEDHCADACLYAYREFRTALKLAEKPREPSPILDPAAWEEKRIAEINARGARAVQARKREERERLGSSLPSWSY